MLQRAIQSFPLNLIKIQKNGITSKIRFLSTSTAHFSVWDTFLKKTGIKNEAVVEDSYQKTISNQEVKTHLDDEQSSQIVDQDEIKMKEKIRNIIQHKSQPEIKPRSTPKYSRRKEPIQQSSDIQLDADKTTENTIEQYDLLRKSTMKSVSFFVNQKMKIWKKDQIKSVQFNNNCVDEKTHKPQFLGLNDERSLFMLEIINRQKKSSFQQAVLSQFTHQLDNHYKEMYPEGQIYVAGSSGCGFDLYGDVCTLTSIQNLANKRESTTKSQIITEIDHLKNIFKSNGYIWRQNSKNSQIFTILTSDYPDLNVVLYVGSLQRLMLTHWAKLNMFLDSRTKLLLTFIKLWLKTYPKLTHYQQLFSDEAIILLVIFYLNHLQILPNIIKEFPNECKLENILNFTTDCFPSYNIEHKDKNISDLFIGFLEFYSKINWNNSFVDMKSMRILKLNPVSNKKSVIGNIKEPFFGNYFFNAAANPQFVSQLKTTFQQVANDLKSNSVDSDADIFYGNKYA